MKSYNLAQMPKVALHPETIKHLKLGHPWVTEDTYTKKFPKQSYFLKSDVGIFIQDQRHKHVKARFWSSLPIEREFSEELLVRINLSVQKRSELNISKERENFLIINGENDLLPGLQVLVLKEQLLIQYYALFWKEIETDLIPIIEKAFQQYFPHIIIKNTWIQERNFDQKKSIICTHPQSSSDFELSEFDINYKIRINENYDYGLYSDMSSIRKQMLPFFKNSKSVLNLFSYTGAFSLFALKQGANEVISVDLSPKYLAWLEENIKINPSLNIDFHQSFNMPTDKALAKLISLNKKFDMIICDPPSASSDGDKISNALKSYEQLLPLMLNLLSPDGKIFAFLNTHQVSWNKYEEKLKQIIASTEFKSMALTGKRFKLSEDYLPIKGFYEGDYLKGILIEVKQNKKGSL